MLASWFAIPMAASSCVIVTVPARTSAWSSTIICAMAAFTASCSGDAAYGVFATVYTTDPSRFSQALYPGWGSFGEYVKT